MHGNLEYAHHSTPEVQPWGSFPNYQFPVLPQSSATATFLHFLPALGKSLVLLTPDIISSGNVAEPRVWGVWWSGCTRGSQLSGCPKALPGRTQPCHAGCMEHKGREAGRRARTSLFRAHHSTLTHRKSPGALQGPEHPPAGRGENKQYFLNLIFKTSTRIWVPIN